MRYRDATAAAPKASISAAVELQNTFIRPRLYQVRHHEAGRALRFLHDDP